MNEISNEIIHNLEYLVIVPKMSEEYYEAFKYTFKNVIYLNNTLKAADEITNYINKNNIGQIIFVDYQIEYRQIIESLNKEHEIKIIFTNSLGALSDEFVRYTFYGLYNIYKDDLAKKIGLLDKGLYEVLKNKGDNVEHIILDIPKEDNVSCDNNSNTIGILNSDKNPKHSFYNELSAIRLTNCYKVKMYKPNKVTKNFVKIFKMKKEYVDNYENLIKNNLVNLYINFTENNYINFIKSMDVNVPCILGNNSILEGYDYLKKTLMINSDDDINEIKEKVELVVNEKNKILDEYQKFRTEYSKKALTQAEKFLECEIEKNKSYIENDILISIIVPVYNVEKYLEKSLKSIIDACIDKTEILIINDGSKDNSEKIIKKYEKKYPSLIRYIKQENHGLGNVRNVGLKEARGKYIASIDSDDTIDIEFFTSCKKYLEKDIDVIIYDWLTVTNEGEYPTPALDDIFKEHNDYEGLLYTTIMPSTCNKIIKKSLFEELDIKYIEDKYEDLSTNPFVLLKAKTIKYIRKPYYEYYIRSTSIMRSSAGLSMIDVLKLVNERIEKYKKYINIDLDEFKYYTYSWRIEEYVLNQLYTLDEKELKSFIEYFEKNIKEDFIKIINNQKYLEKIELLDENDKKYIIERNKAFENGKLYDFIKKARKENKYYMIKPPLIFYGNK